MILRNASQWKKWYTSLEGYLDGEGKSHLLKTTKLKIETMEDDEKETWEKENKKVMSLVCRTVSEDLVPTIMECGNLKETFAALKQEVMGTSLFERDEYITALECSYTGSNMRNHLRQFKSNLACYKSLGGDMKEHDIAMKLLHTLDHHERYRTMVKNIRKDAIKKRTTIDLADCYLDMELTAKSLGQWEPKRSHGNGGGGGRDKKKGFAFKGKAGKKPGKCHNCGKSGHWKRECPEKDDSKNVKKGAAWMAQPSKRMKGEKCKCGYSECVLRILESGASHHMDPARDEFEDLHQIEEMEISTVGNTTYVHEQGKLPLDLIHNDGQTTPATLGDTLCNESMDIGLISVPQLTKRGYTVIFLKDRALIKKNDTTVYVAECRNGIYYVHTRSTRKPGSGMAMSATETWHRRFGHPGKEVLAKMQKNGSVAGLPKGVGTLREHCDACHEGKMARKPVAKETDRPKVTKPLEKLHMDICGPMEVKAWNGEKGFVGITDEATNYRWVLPMKTTKNLHNDLDKWMTNVENQHDGVRVKQLRTDNGPEFTSDGFKKWASDKGIEIEYSETYTPELNGRSERSNRIWMDGVRAMLNDAKLPLLLFQ